MILVRSAIFYVLFYAWSIILGLLVSPILLGPRRWTVWIFKFWNRGVFVMLRAVCGVRVELRGAQNVPQGRALVAAKHQSMFDVFGQFGFLPDSCFTPRKELMWLPIFGWYGAKVGVIVVDREGGSGALRKLVADAKEKLAEERQIVIFPEGHRGLPGETGDYKPGVAGLYRDLGLPVHPVATNSGVHWPAHGIKRIPGVIVFEYLEPIPAGLKRGEFMRLLEERIETASKALL